MKIKCSGGLFLSKSGFTLIELLVVVLIIGILAAVALPQYQFAVEKSRLAGAMTKVAALQRAIDAWVLENGLPTTTSISLLKDNAKDPLVIDVTSGMDCSVGERCWSKDFGFDAFCAAHRCEIDVTKSNGAYALSYFKSVSDGSWHGDECDYWEDSPAYAEKICKYLESQGDGFTACYEC